MERNGYTNVPKFMKNMIDSDSVNYYNQIILTAESSNNKIINTAYNKYKSKMTANNFKNLYKIIKFGAEEELKKEKEINKKYEGIFKFLVQLKGINQYVKIPDSGYNILLAAVRSDLSSLVKILLGIDNLDINFQNKNGKTSLMIAIENENKEMIDILLNPFKYEYVYDLSRAKDAQYNKIIDVSLQDIKGNTVFNYVNSKINKYKDTEELNYYTELKKELEGRLKTS